LLGLVLDGPEPGPLLEKLPALWSALPSASPAAIALSSGTAAVIVALRVLRPHWPGMLLGVAGASVATAALGLNVSTIGSQFGGIPSGLPAPALPDLSMARIVEVLPSAVSFALLGAIESLLSAVVADGMSGRRHRSNCELVAQGIANVGTALFGGFCVTGTIARTATNVRAGAQGPVAGMLHALFLLAFMAIAAPLAAFVPLAALAGVLVVVSWNMVERTAIGALVRSGWGDAAVLAATFLLTVLRDLTEAIVVGFALGSVLFIHRMSRATGVEARTPLVGEDIPDAMAPGVGPGAAGGADPEIVVYRITGAFFFGAASSIGSVLDRISDSHRALVIDFASVPFLDSTGAHVIEGLAHKAGRRGVRLFVAGADPEARRALLVHGIRSPAVVYVASVDEALRQYREAKAV
jgi:SulP family sulfate permease